MIRRIRRMRGELALALAARRRFSFSFIEHIEPLLFAAPTKRRESPLDVCASTPSDIFGHIPTLYLLVTMSRARSVLELGTRDGVSTVALLLATTQTGGFVTSIDVAACEAAHRRIEALGLKNRWTFVQGDDLDVKWKDPIDFAFIDTSHEYQHTLNELKKFEPFVVPGGILALHDSTRCAGVWDALENHFDGRHDISFVQYYNNNGLTIVRKGQDPEAIARPMKREGFVPSETRKPD